MLRQSDVDSQKNLIYMPDRETSLARDFIFNSQNVTTGFSKKLKKKVIVYNEKSQSARTDEFCEN